MRLFLAALALVVCLLVALPNAERGEAKGKPPPKTPTPTPTATATPAPLPPVYVLASWDCIDTMPQHYRINLAYAPPNFDVEIFTAVAEYENLPDSAIDFIFDGYTDAEPTQLYGTGLKVIGFSAFAAPNFLAGPNCWGTGEGSVVFNPQYVFNCGQGVPFSGYDCRAVLLHELGHILGLDHIDSAVPPGTCPYTASPMCSQTPPAIRKHLTAGEQAGMAVLFP